MTRLKQYELPDLVPPSGRGGSWPVLSGTEIWEADFMEKANMPSMNRLEWPPQEQRDLVVEFPVREGEIPNEVVWQYTEGQLHEPFRGNLRRIR
jgi:hypothetical protein